VFSSEASQKLCAGTAARRVNLFPDCVTQPSLTDSQAICQGIVPPSNLNRVGIVAQKVCHGNRMRKYWS